MFGLITFIKMSKKKANYERPNFIGRYLFSSSASYSLKRIIGVIFFILPLPIFVRHRHRRFSFFVFFFAFFSAMFYFYGSSCCIVVVVFLITFWSFLYYKKSHQHLHLNTFLLLLNPFTQTIERRKELCSFSFTPPTTTI